MPRSRGRQRVGNLPVAVTAFVGRDRELRDARRILRDQRLVTLVGTGGVGKTRLAAHLGEGMARAFAGGVWLVDLGPLGDGTDIEDAVCTTLGLAGEQALVAHLDRAPTLLVLDNCEHLLEGCVDFVTALLRLTSDVRVLTTSRQPLGILGEHVLAVRPLSVPPPDTAPRAVEDYDAVRLFVERAGAVVPGFTLAPDIATTVAGICARLGGVPLAIELAATRLRALSLAELADRLDDQHRLLTVGSRVAQPRQRSLGALHDWSHALCTPPERELWARLSVFADGFDLAAAESVCDGDGIARDDVLDLLAGLIEKSLVTREDDGVDVRYAMIEPLRQYGAGRLPDREPYRHRHAAHYAAVAEELGGRRHDEGTPAVHPVVRRDRENFAEALSYLTTRPGHDDDVHAIRALLEAPRASAAESAALRVAASGDLPTALDLLADAVRTHARAGDQYALRRSVRHLAVLAWTTGDSPTMHRVRDQVDRGDLGPGWRPLRAVLTGLERLRDHAPDEADDLFRRALPDLRDSGETEWITLCFDGLVESAAARRDHVRAARLLGVVRDRLGGRERDLDPHGTCETTLRRELGDQRFTAIAGIGAGLSIGTGPGFDEAVDYATGATPDIPAPATGDPRLTPREHEVAGLVRDGLTNQAIGETLVISKRTVESHVEHIMAKLAFTRRTQIATWFTNTHPAADVTASTGRGAPRPTRRSARGW